MNMGLSRKTQKTKNILEEKKYLSSKISEETLRLVKELDEVSKEKLRSFLNLSSKYSINSIIYAAENLPDNCKRILEGIIFHKGILRISLLYAVSNLSEMFEYLADILEIS